MSGVLRLGNTGAGTGRSTLEASASNDQTFTLPSAGGTLLTSNTSIPGGTITLDGATINITNGDLNVDSGTLFVDESTNRVGIGTTSPSGLLDVRGASLLSGVNIRDSSHAITGYVQGVARGFLFATDGSRNIVFDVNAVERMRIDSSGALQIGTSLWPSTTIGQASGRTLIGNEGVIIGWNETVGAGNSSQLYLGTKTGAGATTLGYARLSGGTENATDSASFFNVETVNTSGSPVQAMRIDSNGYVGIGSTDPGAALTISKTQTILSGTGNPFGLYLYQLSNGYNYIDALTDTSSNSSLVLRTYNNGTYNNVIQSISGNETTFSTFGIERARIDSSGRFLVGTTVTSTSSTTKFKLAGDEEQQLTNTSAFVVKKRSISHQYTNLSTSAVAMGEALTSNAAIVCVFLTNVDGDQGTFMYSTGKESGIAHRYSLISGSNGNCSVTLSTNVFTISGLGDGRTYTLTMSTTSISNAPTLSASSATTGTTNIAMCAIGAF